MGDQSVDIEDQIDTIQELDVLLVEDNPADARFIQELLADAESEDHGAVDPTTVTITHVKTLETAVDVTTDRDLDVVLLDLGLPGSRGLETVQRALGRIDSLPVVVLTGHAGQQLGIAALTEGAQDYLVKDDLTTPVLLRTIRYAIERWTIRRELERRNEELAILTRLLRHDIRNDASLIVGRGHELVDHVEPRGEGLLDELIVAANHTVELTRTVGDILERISDRDGVDVHGVDLAAILQSEIAKSRKLYGEGAVTVAGEIPAVEVQANELLGSVFSNLLSNALVYGGTDTCGVTVDVDLDGERVLVHVSDRGPGIPDEMKESIFGKGVSASSTGGLGVGLYVVDRLVDQYAGEVWVSDNEPTGAIFTVALVRAEVAED